MYSLFAFFADPANTPWLIIRSFLTFSNVILSFTVELVFNSIFWSGNSSSAIVADLLELVFLFEVSSWLSRIACWSWLFKRIAEDLQWKNGFLIKF